MMFLQSVQAKESLLMQPGNTIKLDDVRRIYNTSLWIAFAAILCGTVAGLFLLKIGLHYFGYSYPDYLFRIIATHIFFFTFAAASRIALIRCRRRGISQDGQTVETITHNTIGNMQTEAPEMVPVELRVEYGRLWNIFGAVFFALLSIGLVYFLRLGKIAVGERIILVVGLLFGMLLTILFIWNMATDRPSARVDERGVYSNATRGLGIFGGRLIRWEQIAVCEIVSVRDVVGTPTMVYAIFKDTNGKVISSIIPQALYGIANPQRDRLFEYIRRRLSKSGG